MRFVATCVAFGTNLVAFLPLITAGLFLAGIAQSGARGAGLALIAGSLIAFSASVFLIFAPAAAFGGRSRRPLALAAAFVAATPTTALAVAAFLFSDAPFGRAVSAIDWSVFAAGIVFGLGSAATLIVGYWRASERRALRVSGAE